MFEGVATNEKRIRYITYLFRLEFNVGTNVFQMLHTNLRLEEHPLVYLKCLVNDNSLSLHSKSSSHAYISTTEEKYRNWDNNVDGPHTYLFISIDIDVKTFFVSLYEKNIFLYSLQYEFTDAKNYTKLTRRGEGYFMIHNSMSLSVFNRILREFVLEFIKKM